MTTIPPYVAPYVDAAGLHISTYQSILNDNLQAFLNIFGPNQYVAPDSAIYQLLSILSLKQSDCNLGLQLAYNQTSPTTAVGAGLDRIVKMNGLAREPFTYSSVALTLTGLTGTVLNNCFAQDGNGNLWAIPSGTIFITGSINVTAICTTPGNVTAEPGTITIIATPTVGWSTVTNASAAIPGDPIETDSQLRARQAISVARPSLTTLQSTIADVLAVTGVTRINPGTPTPGGPGTSIENPTGAVDFWGNPPHSISMVVEGGTDADVAQAIYIARGIGCFTNGTTTVPVVDANSGYTMNISFFRPTYVPIFVLAHLVGYGGAVTTAILNAVQAAIVTYLNGLQIGETVSISALIYEAMAENFNLERPTFGVTSLLIGQQTAATTATTTIGSNSITVASATGIVMGQLVACADFPAGTTVTGVAGTTITLSNNSMASSASVSIAFSTLASGDIAMPSYTDVAEGLAANVSVVTP